MMTNREIVMDREPAGVLVLEGMRELSRGNEQAALAAFGEALAGTGDPHAELCNARLLVLRRRYDEAQGVLEELVRCGPGLAEAQVLLGIVYRETYRFFDAVRSFRAALRLDPRNEAAGDALRELLDVQEP
jgi:tetratricopeptide (TPR) repeat protein